MTIGYANNAEEAESSSVRSAPSASAEEASAGGRFRSPAYAVLLGLALSAVLFRFVHISLQYPFYYIWDMDQFVVTSSLEFNSNLIPRALFHPGFGMHLLHHLGHGIAHSAGVVSLLTMEDLETSLNPMLGVAELTRFFRFFPPVFSFLTVVSLWLAVVIHFRPSRSWSLLVLAALGTQQSLLYQSAVIRFENYAVFYWSVAVLLVVVATRYRNAYALWGLVCVAGLFLGLSFLSKIQALFYLGSFPLVAMFVIRTGGAWAEMAPRFSKRAAMLLPAITGLGITLFVVMLVLSSGISLPEETIVFMGESGIQMLTVCALVAVGLLLTLQLALFRRRETYPYVYAASALGTFLFVGFLASFLCHFLITPSPRLSWAYLLYDLKATFMFSSIYKFRGFSESADVLFQQLSFSWVLFVALAVVTVVLCVASAVKSVALRLSVISIGLGACGVALFSVAVVTRLRLRDLIWVEVLPTFLTVLFATYVFERSTRARSVFQSVVLVALTALSVSNAYSSRLMVDRLDANYNVFGWQADEWFGTWWNGEAYITAMALEDDSMRDAAFSAARHHRELKRIADYVFKNAQPDLRGLGVVSEGFPVWRRRLDQRIVSFPVALRDALVVDVSWQELKQDVFLTRVERHSESQEKIVSRRGPEEGAGKWLSVLGRADLEVYMFLSRADWASVASRYSMVSARDIWIGLSNGTETRRYWGLEVRRYCALRVDELTSPYFFVVRQRARGDSPVLSMLLTDE